MMNFFKRLSSKRGQAVVEYALLLLIATLSATAFFALDNNMKDKIQTISSDFETDVVPPPPTVIGDPKGCSQNDDCLELSPPVAKFQSPSPNYKGRDIKFIDESYDIDGYVEHYIWSIDGQVIRMNKTDIADKGGLVHSFRNSGTYQVSLLVVDNDGLVSNLESKTVTVLNRNPVLTLTVENESGQLGSSVTVLQGCTATFFTTYTDPDLPYDKLDLLSIFTDQSGVTSSDNTAPNQFTRDFPNLGNNTYYVQVTDEEGSSASATVSVNVIPNPTGNCAVNKNVTKPVFKIVVEGVFTQQGNVYLFKPGAKATVKPSVTWGSYPAHQIPYYWVASQGNTTGQWYTTANGSSLSYPYPNSTFTLSTADITVTGMARDTSALSNNADPSLRGMSNKDTVILRVDGANSSATPTPIISLNNMRNRSDVEPITIVDVSKIANKTFEANVESALSTDDQGFKIQGVRWKLPDGSWRPFANENGAQSITDSKGVVRWFYLGKVNSPDSILNKQKFIWINGAKNEWVYELQVINEKNVVSATTAKKTIKLTNDPNKLPVGVCTPNPVTGYTGQPITLNASGSNDPDGPTPQVRWSNNGGTTYTGWQSPSTNVPTNNQWRWTTPQKFNILLEVKDDKNAVTKVNCPVEIVTTPTADGFYFYPEYWFVEDRVQNAGTDIKVSNRSNPMNKVYYGLISAYGSPGGTYLGTLADETYNAGINVSHHQETRFIDTSNYAATFIVTVHVADSDGHVAKSTCKGGGYIIKKTINGKQIDACSKSSHYFRMAAFTSSGGNLSTGSSGSCTYRSVHKDLKTFTQYRNTWGKGATDATAYYDVAAALKSKLTCR